MTRWPDSQPDRRPSSQRSMSADLMGLGLASTPARELLAAVLQMGLVIVLLFVVFPERIPDLAKWLILGGGVLFFVIRALIGIPKWRGRR